jgi:hypothetical protein
MLKLFGDTEDHSHVLKCVCCYSCMTLHRSEGCNSCAKFLSTFFPPNIILKRSMSVKNELKGGLRELFEAMEVTALPVENSLEVGISSFIGDLIRVIDEIQEPLDVVKRWHVPYDMAEKIVAVLNEVLNIEMGNYCSDSDSEDSVDEFDISSSESDS